MSGLAAVIGPDFHITGGPTEFKVTPLSLAAINWCKVAFKHHITTGSYVISYVDLADIVGDLKDAGMQVQWEYK